MGKKLYPQIIVYLFLNNIQKILGFLSTNWTYVLLVSIFNEYYIVNNIVLHAFEWQWLDEKHMEK